jgi:hypothetical protein
MVLFRKDHLMGLLTPELLQRFREVGEQIQTDQPLILARFYALGTDWERFISEYESKTNTFYGYVIMD